MEDLKSQMIKISGWVECSLVDVINCITFTLWLPYCNFACPWCQNSHIVRGVNSKIMKVEDIINKVLEVRDFIDYFHVTGGEPTLQSKGLRALFRLAKMNDIMVSLDTNGSNPEVVSNLIKRGLIDHLALDVKAPLSDPKKYAEVTGIMLDEFLKRDYINRVVRTLKLALRKLSQVELRIPFIPTLHDEHTILKTIEEVVELINHNRGNTSGVNLVIQQFVPSDTVLSDRFKYVQRTPLKILHRVAKIAIEHYRLDRIYLRSIERGVELIQG